MKSHLNTLREVEDELNIRLRGPAAQPAAGAGSWEFRGARSLQRWMRGAGRRGSGNQQGSTGRNVSADPRQQRVIVKASYTTHHAAKVAGVLRAHVKYLGRDSASLDGREGRFYDAAEEGIDAKQRVQEWQNDARHFRFIVSPEQGHEINDKNGGLTAYTRELMQRLEKDLGTRLEWIAINHFNTDDLHTHVLVRGHRENGKELRIDRQYIQQGMCQAARQIATAWLGERTEQQMQRATDKELKADRHTALDAFIERHVNADRRLHLKVHSTAAGREQRRRVAARLQYLESMGLASRDRHGRWTVDAELKPRLQALSQRNDIIKNLYAALGPRSASVVSYRGEEELIGSVAGSGTHDELRDRRYLLVRDSQDRLHYVRVANAEALAPLEQGAIVSVAGADPQRLRTDARIAEVARQNNGVYSVNVHRNDLPSHFAGRDVEAFLHSHERRLTTLHKLGAAERVEGGWRIRDVDALASGEQARLRGGLGVVQIVSSRSIDSQITVDAWTWLDRQIHRQDQGKTTSIPFDPALQQAAESRQRWMTKHAYAMREGERYMVRPGSAQTLRQKEWQALQQKFREQFGKRARPLSPGAQAEGQYRGTVSLHDGLYAAVAGQTEVVLAPVQRVPPLAYGSRVEVRTSTRGVAVLCRTDARQIERVRQTERGAERD